MSLHVVHVILMLIFMAYVSLAKDNEKIFPDFTCHPNHFPEAKQKERLQWRKSQWSYCKDAEEERGTCHKACMLGSNGMFNHYPANDKNGDEPDIKRFVRLLLRMNGYDKGAGGEPAEKLMAKVGEGMKKCVVDHPEVKKLSIDDACVKWDPFINCVTGVLGC